MTKKERTLCAKLKASCDLASDDDFDTYAAAARALGGSDDPGVLREMLRCVRDNEAGEIQYELIEACERFPVETFVPAVLAEGRRMLGEAPRWFGLLFQSMLNSPDYIKAIERFRDTLSPGDRAYYAGHVRRLARQSARYRPLVSVF